MKKILNRQFIKNNRNLFILHDRFSFWNFFKILRRNNYEPDQALNFIFENCSLSAIVFQECILNNNYKNLG